MNYLKCLRYILLLSVSANLCAAENLIFAIDIIRHGDRTPIKPLAIVPYQWKEGIGQLTAVGMQQEYKMGMVFREKYIEHLHLLPKHYKQGTMYVRSTAFDRTLMSAESLLMGLYPPGTGPQTSVNSLPALPNAFQPIPIYSAPFASDDIIIQQVPSQEIQKLREQYVYSTKEWQQKNNELKSNYPLWSRLTGVAIFDLKDLQMLSDTLYIHKLHNIPMPEGLNANDIETIIDAGEWAFMQQEKPLQIARLYSTKLMTQIGKFLSKGRLNTSKLKYVLLSAHDSTITSVLSFLGAPLDKSPPYASNLNFGLYETDLGGYTLKITYNGQAVSIPACSGSLCELEQFLKLIEETSN